MRTLMKASLLAMAIVFSPVWADEASPVGLWKNIDDLTGKPKALIRITEEQGMLQGRVVQLFRSPDQDQHPLCVKCEGANKDQPMIGMVIVWDLKKDGAEYSGGKILDPNNGKVYQSKLSIADGGEKLHVRGYVGMPLFGRSQTWIRQH